MQSQPSSIATRTGMIAGVALGILSLPVITLSVIGRAAGVRGGLPTLFLLVALVVFAVVGFSASRYSGLARSGVWAALLAALITTFIAICLGVVIVILLASNASAATLAGPVARRAGRGAAGHLALGVRLALIRLTLGSLILLAGSLIVGLSGGLLGRIGRPGGGREQRAPDLASDAAAQTRAYTASYTPAASPTAPPAAPPLYTPAGYDDNTPTIVHDSQE